MTTAWPRRIDLGGPTWTCKGYLGDDWLMRRAVAPDTRDLHGWHPATVPGSVVADLVAAGDLEDPRRDRASLAAEWVATRSWVYRRTVDLDAADLAGRHVELEVGGIDHAASIHVNGVEVAHHVGASRPLAVDVTARVRPGPNLLAVVVEPAPPSQPHIGRSDRVRVAKSRMTYGWDFCPRLVHQGICDRVELVLHDGLRLRDLVVRAIPVARARDVGPPDPTPGRGALGPAPADDWRVDWELELEARPGRAIELGVELRSGRNVVGRHARVVSPRRARSVVDGSLPVRDPARWWPNGEGAQPHYAVVVRVATAGPDTGARQAETTGDRREVTTAFRTVDWVPNEGAPEGARPHTLVVNGRRLEIRGWNWVPMDLHLAVGNPERLDHLLGLAVRAGVNLLRVWGGGPPESRAFYDRCDRLGLLVWQEFPLSSSMMGSVPSVDPGVVDAFRTQARAIVRERRNHPSLALWCGGNELDGVDGLPADGSQPVLVALSEVVAELDPGRAWLPTSPDGPVATLTEASLADDPSGLHDVHGPWEYQGLRAQHGLANRSTAQLHSEFGVEGLTNRATIEAWLSPECTWPADRSNPAYVHRGDFWINTPMLEEVFGPFEDLAALVQASQLLQAEGLRTMIEANRRRLWRCSGSLPWQFGEPFPNAFCTSAVDHGGRPKLAYHAVAATYAPVLVHAELPTQAFGRDPVSATIWVTSTRERLDGARVTARLRRSDGAILRERDWDVDVPGESATTVGRVAWPLSAEGPETCWLDLELVDGPGHLRSRNRYPVTTTRDWRALRRLRAPELRARPCEPDVAGVAAHGRADPTAGPAVGAVEIANVGEVVAFGVRLVDRRPRASSSYAWFGDGALVLFPGETATVAWGTPGDPDDVQLAIEAWGLPDGVPVDDEARTGSGPVDASHQRGRGVARQGGSTR